MSKSRESQAVTGEEVVESDGRTVEHCQFRQFAMQIAAGIVTSPNAGKDWKAVARKSVEIAKAVLAECDACDAKQA